MLGTDIHIAGDNMYVGTTTPLVPDGYKSSPFLALQVTICCPFVSLYFTSHLHKKCPNFHMNLNVFHFMYLQSTNVLLFFVQC